MSETVPLRLVGVGPQRTGSTWLDVQLRRHPGLAMPEHVKETFFFDRHYARGLTDYRSHFASGAEAWAEIGPTYFDHPEAPARIRLASPEARIVVTLRDPIDRAVSLFQHHARKGRVGTEFWAAAEAQPSILTAGDYADHLGLWRETFGDENVLVLLLDDIQADPAAALARLTDWAGIAPLAPEAAARERVNAASAPRFPLAAKVAARAVTFLRDARLHRVVELGKRLGLQRVYGGSDAPPPTITAADRQRLAERYAPHVAAVEALLGRDLGWLSPPDAPPPEARRPASSSDPDPAPLASR
ncbi:MAG: sulfotransferase domain-containing protein [Bacteroidota bacterium]